jgi:hypothetical protein
MCFFCTSGDVRGFAVESAEPMDCTKLAQGAVHPELLRFATHCDELAGGREMLRRRDFHPADVPWMLGSLYVVEVLSDDYRFKIFGSVMTTVYGNDFTGWRLSEIPLSIMHPAMRAYLHSRYDDLVACRGPLFQHGKMVWKNAEIDTERLMIPLMEDDGRLSEILVAVFCDIPEDFLAVFRTTGAPDLIPRADCDQFAD